MNVNDNDMYFLNWFHLFTASTNGKLLVKQLEKFLIYIGISISNKELSKVLNQYESNNKEFLEFEEAKAEFLPYLNALNKNVVASSLLEIDFDKDGIIEKEDFEYALKNYG